MVFPSVPPTAVAAFRRSGPCFSSPLWTHSLQPSLMWHFMKRRHQVKNGFTSSPLCCIFLGQLWRTGAALYSDLLSGWSRWSWLHCTGTEVHSNIWNWLIVCLFAWVLILFICRPSVSRDCGTLRLRTQLLITLCLTVMGGTSCGALSIFASFLFHLYRVNIDLIKLFIILLSRAA